MLHLRLFLKKFSGKSSIIQSINLLAQNYFRGDGLETIDGNGSLTNLGLFDAYVHKHNKKEEVKYSLPSKDHQIKKDIIRDNGYQLSFTRNQQKSLNLLNNLLF